jgi:arylsulfatase A-like enzyme
MKMQGGNRWIGGLLALVLVVAVAGAACAAPKGRPNIIFILADDLGYGDVGFSWEHQAAAARALPRIATPHIDRLAREGVVLTDHYCAAPVCAPSRASLLTGRVQGKCSLRDNCFDRPFTEKDTLGTVMKSAGYATWAVGKWGIAGGGESGEPVSSHPLDRGFDYFYGFLDHMAGHTYYHYEGHIRGAFMGITENRTNATASAEGIYSTDLFAAKAKQLISDHLSREPETPFFMYLAVNTVHGSAKSDDTLACKDPVHVPGRPYPEEGVAWPLEKEPLEARNTWIDSKYANLPPVAARYATSITRLDDAIGDLVRHLKRHGLDRDTLIVFTSDNGPANEYGVDPRTFGSAGPFDGMKRDVFEGGMRVPTFVRWPARVAAGTVDRQPSQFHDWIATLADAARTPKPAATEGVSLLPRWDDGGKNGAPASLVYSQYEFPWGGGTAAFRAFEACKKPVRGLQQMVREGDYVALRTRIREGGAKVRLYNVVADPFEERDLANDPEQGERLARLTAVLDARLN